jgi:hypothetical protein
MRELADRFERSPGSVLQRLHRVGCDPTSPGVARFAPVPGETGGAVGQDA